MAEIIGMEPGHTEVVIKNFLRDLRAGLVEDVIMCWRRKARQEGELEELDRAFEFHWKVYDSPITGLGMLNRLSCILNHEIDEDGTIMMADDD